MFKFPDPDPLAPPLLGFNDVSFSYPGSSRVIFRDVNFGIDMQSRLSIVGPNGVGKSTLLGLINGALQPQPGQGFVHRSPKLRMATFTQHHVDGLDLAVSPLAHMVRPGARAPERPAQRAAQRRAGRALAGGRGVVLPRGRWLPSPGFWSRSCGGIWAASASPGRWRCSRCTR